MDQRIKEVAVSIYDMMIKDIIKNVPSAIILGIYHEHEFCFEYEGEMYFFGPIEMGYIFDKYHTNPEDTSSLVVMENENISEFVSKIKLGNKCFIDILENIENENIQFYSDAK